jgi:regulatory protein RepA
MSNDSKKPNNYDIDGINLDEYFQDPNAKTESKPLLNRVQEVTDKLDNDKLISIQNLLADRDKIEADYKDKMAESYLTEYELTGRNVSNKLVDNSLDLQSAFLNVPPKLDFVFKGFKKRTVGFLTAPGSTGKGFFSLSLAMSISDTSRTFNFLDLASESRGRVLFLTMEDEHDILNSRLHSIFQSLDYNQNMLDSITKNLTVKSLRGSQFNLYGIDETSSTSSNKSDIKSLTEACKDTKLVIIDTLSKFHKEDENSNSKMSALVKIFETITTTTDTSFLIIHHSSKSATMGGSLDSASSSRGASSIIDNARFQITMSTMTKDEAKEYSKSDDERKFYVQVHFAKINYSKPLDSIWLKRGDGGVLSAVELDKYVQNKNNNGGRKNA